MRTATDGSGGPEKCRIQEVEEQAVGGPGWRRSREVDDFGI